MKAWRALLLLLLVCTFLYACGPESDVVIGRHDETQATPAETETRFTVIINQNTMTYHIDPACRYAARMAEENRLEIAVPDLEYLTEHGYTPCNGCSQNK